ncbi:MAG: electron transfer flavoprotein subunit beta [bacterium]|nr:electron transfer flavoprotein subunit beta [bacterium]
MHIVVCVKMVPDTTLVQIDPKTNTLVREGVPFITNPFDTHAVEEALRLKDRYGGKVTALSMGPPAAEMVLRRALALGADEAVLLSDRAFGGADTLATSKVLSEAIRRIHENEPVDLVFCGLQTIDGDTAQVGPGVACRLGFTQLTLVDHIYEVNQRESYIEVRRKLEGAFERVQARMPALITTTREINTPRYPTVPGRLQAASRALPVWSNDVMKLERAEIGLQGSPTNVRRIFAPQREKGEIINGLNGAHLTAADCMLNKLYEWDILNAD